MKPLLTPIRLLSLTAALCSCDGAFLDVGSEKRPSSETNGVDAEGRVATTRLDAPECAQLIGGTSTSDVWCVLNEQRNAVGHWDGTAWSKVELPYPASDGRVEEAQQAAIAGPNKLLVYTSYGLARIAPAGAGEQLVLEGLKGSFLSMVQVGERVVMLMLEDALGAQKYVVYASDGGRFERMRGAELFDGRLAVSPAGALWLVGTQKVSHFDGGGWNALSYERVLDAPTKSSVFVGEKLWTFHGAPVYFPPGTHETEPLSEALTREGELVPTNPGPEFRYEEGGVVPGSFRRKDSTYEGVGLLRTTRSTLALVGCVDANRSTEHIAINELKDEGGTYGISWDERAPGFERRIDVACDPGWVSLRWKDAGPIGLADGTWLFPSRDSYWLAARL